MNHVAGEHKIDSLKQRAREYIEKKQYTVTFTGEEWDYIAVIMHNIKNPNTITEKLKEIFKIDTIDSPHKL